VDLSRILQAWTKGRKLLRGDHYFWILGEHVQKSLNGLLRAVLHALLSGLSQSGDSEDLETTKHVCEARWQSVDRTRAWNCKELKEMLSRLALTSNTNIFLLIDALDEFEQQDRVGDLASEIVWLSQLPNIKICASCRPWTTFTKHFEKSPVLHLDRLTFHDMEVSIEKRLLSAEAEADLYSPFRDATRDAKQLVADVALAAEGVFLWVELVVNALCSEIRSGCHIEQLHLTIADFPSDLDDYLQRLVFGRIGTTRPNVPKTASALKLAMLLQIHEKLPLANDYLNFWLLSTGHLKLGFSWTDHVNTRYSAVDAEQKIRQTKAFLEETCKDLLVIHRSRGLHTVITVSFLHRSVCEFLRENSASLQIEHHAPRHFSHTDFIVDLTKLRCICHLREAWMDCQSLEEPLEKMLAFFNKGTEQRAHMPWLLSCEDIVLEIIQTRCNCLGLMHLDRPHLTKLCARSGLERCLLETAKLMPHRVFAPRRRNHDYLGLALFTAAREKLGSRKGAAVPLLYQALEHGCDPNLALNLTREQAHHGQTKWEEWLRAEYQISEQLRQRTGTGEGSLEGPDAADLTDRLQENALIVDSLLRHGADPYSTPCTAEHDSRTVCFRIALQELLRFIVPAEWLTRLSSLLINCSTEERRFTLRRNQRIRALKSLVVSEQRFFSLLADGYRSREAVSDSWKQTELNSWKQMELNSWKDVQKGFLGNLVSLDAPRICCPAWVDAETSNILITWCVDCHSRSYVCFSCLPPHSLTPDAPCTDISIFRSRQISGHTAVTLLASQKGGSWYRGRHPRSFCEDQPRFDAVYEFLGCGPGELDLTPEAALSVLKEWYAKNPIEPDSLQDDY
jgi:hypothetical protein